MLAALAPAHLGSDRELEDAREALSYWETRAHSLPRHAVRRRREARDMAARWQVRVAEAERHGLRPRPARRAAAARRRAPAPAAGPPPAAASSLRRLAQAAMVAFVCLVALVVAGAWAAVELVSAVLGALDLSDAVSARLDVVLAQVLEVERPQHLGDLAPAGVGDVVGVGAEAQDVGLGLVHSPAAASAVGRYFISR